MDSRVHHFALNVGDLDKSKRFYMQAFGYREYGSWRHGAKRICMLRLEDGTFFELHENAPVHHERAHYWHISFSSDDIDALYRRALEAGGTPDRPPFDHTIVAEAGEIPVRIAWLRGPDGEAIELFSEQSRMF